MFQWHQHNHKNYPWRNTINPYYILVAEFLLQETHVRKVQDAYLNICNTYTDVESLAIASLDEIQLIIKPIGLAYRAERLKGCANSIVKDYGGNVPGTKKELLTFPGVGQYIANAALCYAFDKATVPIDTNVIRLFCRYFGFTSSYSRPRTDGKLAEIIRKQFSYFTSTRDANLAVLDFVSSVCTARKPSCTSCPLENSCCKNL